jgi:diguanylate cyclase (GGDEF)-like protein
VEFEGRDGVFIALNDITERKHLEARLEHQINTDDLTGLASRRRILDLLLQEFERARRYASPLAILAVDIDHFKQINDTCGHDGGDEALRVFAGVLRGGLRSPDMAGRMGGEEFMVVLPETGPEEARQAAERLRQMVEARGVSLDKKILRLTVSIGIASIETCDSVEELMKAADHALYAAKDAGRNRCVFQSCKLH